AGGDRDPARRDRADRPPRRPAVRADAAADRPSARLPGGTGAGRVLTHRHSQVERYTDGLAVTKPQCQLPLFFPPPGPRFPRMNVKLRPLRVVVLVEEAGSVGRAARWLKVSQPSLTAQLKRIEAAFGGE